MCGIAGAFDLEGRRDFPRDRLLRMTGSLAHRGPDDEGIHLEPGLALGSRRLAIIDREGALNRSQMKLATFGYRSKVSCMTTPMHAKS